MKMDIRPPKIGELKPMRHLALTALMLLITMPVYASGDTHEEALDVSVKMSRTKAKDARTVPLQTNHDAMTFATDVEALNNRIAHLEGRFTQLLKEVTHRRAEFANLEEELRSADLTLKNMEKPLRQARTQYKKAQDMSLEYPEVSTERERKAYYEIKKRITKLTKGQTAGVESLKSRLTVSYESLESAEEALDRTRHEADQLRSQLSEANGVIRPVSD
ncbi:hypothetical protein [Magnetococcus sp. PR-3]|uniref:hypothetical protein n=1 Tax=Magnetococcus sp. PR-3 TaxID=3120355 RepID=UPI002FCE40DE